MLMEGWDELQMAEVVMVFISVDGRHPGIQESLIYNAVHGLVATGPLLPFTTMSGRGGQAYSFGIKTNNRIVLDMLFAVRH
jgi:hypothetical protein